MESVIKPFNVDGEVRGFTLLEVLAALAIFSFMSAVLLPVLYSSVRLSERGYQLAENLERTKTAEALIRRLATAAVVPDEDLRHLRFDANVYLVRFLVVDSMLDGPAFVELKASTTGSEQDLELTVYSVDIQKTRRAQASLLGQYQSISFSYFGDAAQLGVSTWHTNWLASHPPALMSVNLVASDGGRSSIDVRLPVDAKYFCDYDSVSRKCR